MSMRSHASSRDSDRRVVLAAGVCAVLGSMPALIAAQGVSAATGPHLRIRVIVDGDAWRINFSRARQVASERNVDFEIRHVEAAGEPNASFADADLVILETRQPIDVIDVQRNAGSEVVARRVPWLKIAPGPPTFGNLAPLHASRLIGYYLAGGEANLKALLIYADAIRKGTGLADIPAPIRMPAEGVYHPGAPVLFGNVMDYFEWGAPLWKSGARRIAFAIRPEHVSRMETEIADALIFGCEKRGLAPIAFWTDATDPHAMSNWLKLAEPDALIMTLSASEGADGSEHLSLAIPVVWTVSRTERDIRLAQDAEAPTPALGSRLTGFNEERTSRPPVEARAPPSLHVSIREIVERADQISLMTRVTKRRGGAM
jgi:cobaltochelatase CobN